MFKASLFCSIMAPLGQSLPTALPTGILLADGKLMRLELCPFGVSGLGMARSECISINLTLQSAGRDSAGTAPSHLFRMAAGRRVI